MTTPIAPILAQSRSVSDPIDAVLAVLLIVTVVGGVVLLAREKRRRLAAESALGASRALRMQDQSRVDAGQEERNQVMFDQHRRINELQIAKLAAEVELLQGQVKVRPVDADRIEAGKEAHELMVEKMKLEIDSLRLHITEMRKRMEDWRLGGD